MMRYVRDLRLIPIALIASVCLLALKTADLVLDGSGWFADEAPPQDGSGSIVRAMPDAPQPPGVKLSWAQQMFNFPNSAGAPPIPGPPPAPADADITGSVTADAGRDPAAAKGDRVGSIDNGSKDAKETKAAKQAKDDKPFVPTEGMVIPSDGVPLPSGAERAILERLQERRRELDARARELDIRESMVKAAEQRIEAKLAELKAAEARLTTDTQQQNDAEAARLKGLVTMYEAMKPRDAAKIFNRLDLGVLIEVASHISPRQMAEILAQMSPDVADRLTVELANKATHAQTTSPAELPKIEGRPLAP